MMRACAILTAALASTGAVSAATGKDYPGNAQHLAPTPTEVGFTKLVAFAPAKKPPANELHGYKTGVAAFYEKGPVKTPVQAITTIYVYDNAADAKAAWSHLCTACPSHGTYQGIALMSGTTTAGGSTDLTFVTNCRNIDVKVLIAYESLKALNNDAGVIAGAVYVRARGMGMSPCA